MLRQLLLLTALSCVMLTAALSQSGGTTPATAVKTDSTRQAPADSAKHAKAIADSIKMAKLFAVAQYPYIKGSKWSGVIPVDNPTEIPDPHREYKLLFELTQRNRDSLAKEINESLDEVARIMNLHFASGIPAAQIKPVIVLHGPVLEALLTDENYRKKHQIDNPNVKLVRDLQDAGASFIACGQAMAFQELKRDQFLPGIKVSLTAQTVLSNYQLQGYVLYSIDPRK